MTAPPVADATSSSAQNASAPVVRRRLSKPDVLSRGYKTMEGVRPAECQPRECTGTDPRRIRTLSPRSAVLPIAVRGQPQEGEDREPIKLASKEKLPERLEVRKFIGKGSYGCVIEAFDHAKQKMVAVKRLDNIFGDLHDCKRILREIAIMARLNHPNVVELYDLPAVSDVGTFDELFIVMELCDTDMGKLLKADVSLTPRHTTTLLYNLLVGLKYLHSACIYHRDLKPANCLVNADCSVKICDFGLSRAVDEIDDAEDSKIKAAAGQGRRHSTTEIENRKKNAESPQSEDVKETSKDTDCVSPLARRKPKRKLTNHVTARWYRAPELILLQQAYTEAVDVWSVGCIYAELLGMHERRENRRPLFPGSSCYPLSPVHGKRLNHELAMRDQLNMIFDLLGTPSSEDISFLELDGARAHVKCFAKREGKGIREALKHVEVEDGTHDFLAAALIFNPERRSKITELLDFSLFAHCRDTSRETSAQTPIQLPFENFSIDEFRLRSSLFKEITAFRNRQVGGGGA